MKTGFFKIHRKILDWQWFKHPNTVVVWLTLLSLAEWQTGCDLKPGQLVISQKELSEITGLSRQQIRTAISHLESTKEITKIATKEATNPKMLITVENWRLYQHNPKDTNQDTNQGTNQGCNLSSIIKEDKEDKEEKERATGTDIKAVPMPQDFKERLETMFAWRKDN